MFKRFLFSWFFLFVFLLLFLFLFSFLGLHLSTWRFPGWGVESELQLPTYATATSVTYTTAHGDAESLTH